MGDLGSRVLFLHHNFPAQFRHLAMRLAELGHEVVFLSERNLIGELPGIRQHTVSSSKPLAHANLYGQLACSERFRIAMQELRDQGWTPDLVISHSGWGCGLDVSWVFPEARRISYLEWWFANNAADYDYDPDNPWWSYSTTARLKLRHRNLTLALELSEAHAVVTPTRWQRSQLPEALQQRCSVIHEGVDTSYFMMNTAWRPKEHLRLTYATRGMEPMRGFPEFVEVLPELLERWQKLEVVIAGDDRVAYGAQVPEEGSFGRWAAAKLKPWLKAGRVRMVGHLPLQSYARLLKSSHVHCYLSRPFVASWSLLEAMASGCCLVASDVEPVRELAHAEATTWVDHRSHDELFSQLQTAIQLGDVERSHRGAAQRNLASKAWSRRQSLDKWIGLLGI
jgi:glycosyltransferase involved in cell wall biosynthesis